jgi:hypothetical protein
VNIATPNNNVGFFGAIRNGTVKNLKLSGGMVNGGWYIGGLVGFSSGGTYEDCYTDLTVYSAGGSKVGGLVGFLSYGTTVNRCANYGSVSAHHTSGLAGGIAGQIYSTTQNVISNSFNRGSIKAHGQAGLAGGIFGYCGDVLLNVQNCYNAAPVTSVGSAGAIVAGYDMNGKITFANTYFAQGYNSAPTAFPNINEWNTAAGSGTIQPMTQEAMKSQATADRLNGDDFTYVATANDGYPIHKNTLHAPGTTGHTYEAVVTAPTCTTSGYTTYICTGCGYTTVENIPATGHSYIWGTCTACGHVDESYVTPDYYLFGYINGANYACEEDDENMGFYIFVNGKVYATFN